MNQVNREWCRSAAPFGRFASRQPPTSDWVIRIVAKRSSFLLRIDPKLLDALRKWADDELRSVNGQVEYLLRRAAKEAGRLEQSKGTGRSDQSDDE